MQAPLKGVRVLDLSRLIPGPFCTLVLSDLGASVDKLEDPHVGDYMRVFPPTKRGLSGRFIALNRDKRARASTSSSRPGATRCSSSRAATTWWSRASARACSTSSASASRRCRSRTRGW